MSTPVSESQLTALCHELHDRIHLLVEARSAGRVDENGLVDALLQFERDRVAPYGLILTASNSYDDWTVLTLQVAGTREPCASFEFSLETHQFRPAGTVCRAGDPALALVVTGPLPPPALVKPKVDVLAENRRLREEAQALRARSRALRLEHSAAVLSRRAAHGNRGERVAAV